MILPTPFPSHIREFNARLSTFVGQVGAKLSPAEILDLTGHLFSDEIHDLRREVASHHLTLFHWDASGQLDFQLSESRLEAWATVYSHALNEGHDIDAPEDAALDSPGLETFELDGDVYATVQPVEYVIPQKRTVERIETLLRGIQAADELLLLKKLSELPAWSISYANHQTLPRTGEWLPKFSFQVGPDAPDPNATPRAVYDRLRKAAIEVNKQPMGVTPQSLAKLLQTELSVHCSEKLKLSRCQEGLAWAYGFASWNHLVARHNKEVLPQVMYLASSEADLTSIVRVYRTPVEALAAVYELALDEAAQGRRLFVEVGWSVLGGFQLQHRLCSREDLYPESQSRVVLVDRETARNWQQWTLAIVNAPLGVSEEGMDEARAALGLQEAESDEGSSET